MEQQWRGLHPPAITRLGVKPKGQRRIDLVQQLVEFSIPSGLPAVKHAHRRRKRYFSHLLLYHNLLSLSTKLALDKLVASKTAVTRCSGFSTWPGLQNEEGQFFVPFEMFAADDLSAFRDRAASYHAPAVDPRLLLTKVQQPLGLVQSKNYHTNPPALAHAPRWLLWQGKRLSAARAGRFNAC